MSYDPTRNLLITNVNRVAAVITMVQRDKVDSVNSKNPHLVRAETGFQLGTPYIVKRDYLFTADERGLQMQTNPPWGTIAAINPSKGTLVWEKPLGFMFDPNQYADAPMWGSINLGGNVLTGGGLCFVAATVDNYFRAFDSKTGELLWKDELPAGGQATPMTYFYKNKQYIVIAAGGHGKLKTKLGDYLIAYCLN